MGGLADLLGEPVILPNKICLRDLELVLNRRVGEVENLFQVGADLEHLTGQKRRYAQSLSLGLAAQFRNNAWSREAKVEHREAVRRVEPPAKPTCAVATARIESLRLVAVGDDGEGGSGQLAERPGVERRHVRRSRPPPAPGGGRPLAGTDRRR